ncbi:MAG: hypothetical protein K2N94_03335 [Lachnospiraceae bacterium]|nr:hypothetical protein [Lachnospiraceae bacterium]
MGNVFKKLMRKEFGEGAYERYCGYIYGEQESRVQENRMIFEEMYLALKDKDMRVLQGKKEQLDRAILQAFVICRNYWFAAAAALLTALLVCLLIPGTWLLYLLLMADAAGFAAKTGEYISNKYCYVDARIILIYKSVLDKLCPGRRES